MKVSFMSKTFLYGRVTVNGKRLVNGEIYDFSDDEKWLVEMMFPGSLLGEEKASPESKTKIKKTTSQVDALLEEIAAGKHDEPEKLSNLLDEFSGNKSIENAVAKRMEHL